METPKTSNGIGPAGERERSVSPDGSSVLFLTRDWEIAQLSFSTGVITILSHPPYGTWDLEAAWSPDGKAIAFGLASSLRQPRSVVRTSASWRLTAPTAAC